MAKWGIKVSQPNKDVKTCADKDLVFSSDWNTPKIVESGMTTLAVAANSQGQKTIYHNYGWVGVLVYVNLKPNEYYFCDSSSYYVGPGYRDYAICKIEENSFTVSIRNITDQEITFNVSYFILREEMS